MKFRVFISSVQSEFAEERIRLVDYIRKDALLGMFFEPFIFEEIHACDSTPQGVYLNEVKECDIYIGLLGCRFGHEVDSGVSATESEYELATKLQKTRLVFLKEVLLFAKAPQREFISSEVKCLQYWGDEVERPIPSYRFYQGGLIQMIEGALAFVMSRIDHEVSEPGGNGSARGIDELPELAVREAIVNAVCHRDYSDNGSVQVMLFRNRLEIINPGPLPKGWTVDRLLHTHDSKARNLVLAQALNWAGYVEKSGNGTEAIVRRCVQCGLRTPEYHPDNTDFKVIIWRRAQSGHGQGTVRAQSGHSKGVYLSPRERCLELLTGGEMRRKEIAAALGYPNQSGYLNRLLRDLVSDCLIERTLPDKPNSSQQRYRLTEKAVTVLGSIKSQN